MPKSEGRYFPWGQNLVGFGPPAEQPNALRQQSCRSLSAPSLLLRAQNYLMSKSTANQACMLDSKPQSAHTRATYLQPAREQPFQRGSCLRDPNDAFQTNVGPLRSTE